MSRIGRYAIRKFLGEGGMGLVYLAEREDLGSLAGGNPDEAETGYLRALEIYRATYQGKHSRVGVAKANLAQLVAGYDIVSRSSRPSMFWLRTAREDLANVYETLNQAERAARYRADPGDSP